MKPKLAIVTGNTMKYAELAAALASFFDCEQKKLEGYDEVQGNADYILKHKLTASYAAFKQPILVDDTSVYFDALHGFPGPYFKDFVALMKPYDMGMYFFGTRMRTECRIAIMYTPDDVVYGLGIAQGTVMEPKTHDDQGRELDLFMQVDGTDRVMLDYAVEEKNAFSHRGLAVKDLLNKLAHR